MMQHVSLWDWIWTSFVIVISGALLLWVLWPIDPSNTEPWKVFVLLMVPALLGILVRHVVLAARAQPEIERAEKWIRWAEAVGVVQTPRFCEQEIRSGELCGIEVDSSIFGAGPCAFEVREKLRERFPNINFYL